MNSTFSPMLHIYKSATLKLKFRLNVELLWESKGNHYCSAKILNTVIKQD